MLVSMYKKLHSLLNIFCKWWRHDVDLLMRETKVLFRPHCCLRNSE